MNAKAAEALREIEIILDKIEGDRSIASSELIELYEEVEGMAEIRREALEAEER